MPDPMGAKEKAREPRNSPRSILSPTGKIEGINGYEVDAEAAAIAEPFCTAAIYEKAAMPSFTALRLYRDIAAARRSAFTAGVAAGIGRAKEAFKEHAAEHGDELNDGLPATAMLSTEEALELLDEIDPASVQPGIRRE